MPAIGGGVGAGAAFLIEAILTFFLVWVIFATAADPRGTFKSIAGPRDRLHDHARHPLRRPLHRRGDEPGPAFGPQIVGGHWSDAWVWYLGPALGGILAAFAYERLYLSPPDAPPPDPSVGPPEGPRRLAKTASGPTPPPPRAPPRARPSPARLRPGDRVADRVLPVAHGEPGRLEQVARVAAELDADHPVVGAVRDRDLEARPRLEVELEAFHPRDEAAQREDCRRSRPAGGEAERYDITAPCENPRAPSARAGRRPRRAGVEPRRGALEGREGTSRQSG